MNLKHLSLHWATTASYLPTPLSPTPQKVEIYFAWRRVLVCPLSMVTGMGWLCQPRILDIFQMLENRQWIGDDLNHNVWTELFIVECGERLGLSHAIHHTDWRASVAHNHKSHCWWLDNTKLVKLMQAWFKSVMYLSAECLSVKTYASWSWCFFNPIICYHWKLDYLISSHWNEITPYLFH